MEDSKFKFQIFHSQNPWLLITEQNALKFIHNINKNNDCFFNFNQNKDYYSPKEAFYKFPFDEFCEKTINSTNYFFNQAKQKNQLEKQVQPLCREELKHFFSVISLMQDYQFPDYRDHFKLQSQNFIQSPIAKLMPLGRFQILLKYMELDTKEFSYDLYNFFFDSLLSSDFLIKENLNLILILKIKKLRFKNSNNLKLFLVYDQSGYLLNGLIVNESLIEEKKPFFDQITQVLFKFSTKNHTLILPHKIFSMDLIEFLQNELKFKCIGTFFLNAFQNIYDLPQNLKDAPFLKKKSIYCCNKESSLLALKERISPTHLKYMVFGSYCFYNQSSNLEICDQASMFHEEIFARIKKLWKISIWNEFDQEHMKWPMEIIFFLFQSFMNNAYILYSTDFLDFSSFKEKLIDELITWKKEVSLMNSKLTVNRDNTLDKGHYPERMNYCKICKVCKKNKDAKRNKKKTLYKCPGCSWKMGRDVSLCVVPCFETYHCNIEIYNEDKKLNKRMILKKNLNN